MTIIKSRGTTSTERALAILCDRTFLRLWSYANPFRADGNELCDLLAVFDNHVFIFFDREAKHLQESDGTTPTNWDRWKRHVVDRQIRSARGAERYLKQGRGVYLDPRREVPFPLTLQRDSMIYHKIIVAHGAAEACKKFSTDNINGSLGVSYGRSVDPFQFPFVVHLDKEDPVHVLDSYNLPIIFSELDTVNDFVWYLEAKLRAINDLDMLFYCGEEDLLAHYFLNFDSTANKHFIGVRDKKVNGLSIGEGEWQGLIERPEYRRKKAADRTSYLWDDLIQRTSQNALDGTLLGNADLLRGRSAIHEMAREPRFMRRGLSDEMLRAVQAFPDSPGRIMRHVSLMPSYFSDKAYVFLQLRVKGESDSRDDYREKRRALLEVACGAAKNKQAHLNTVVGIAIDAPKFTDGTAEDFLLLDTREWTEERRTMFDDANRDLQFFRTAGLKERKQSISNFPSDKEGDSSA
jgi:hypothetical protein